MPPAPPASNIRAFVQWRDPSVYAGEEIECIITFKNVAIPPGQEKRNGEHDRQPSGLQGGHSRRSSIAQSKAATHSKAPSVASTKSAQFVRGHRPALSLNVVTGTSKGGIVSAPVTAAKGPNSAVKPAAGHGRSLSIMSYGSDAASEGRGGAFSASAAKRPVKGHGRSASLQVLPKPTPQPSPYVGGISPRQPSPLMESSTPPPLNEGQNEPLPIRPARRRPGTVSMGNTPQLGRQNSLHKSPGSATFNPGFQFPPPSQPQRKSPSPSRPERPPRPPRSPSNMHSGQHRATSPRPPEGWSGALSNLNPISRVMSESSTTGTPRTSSEFYSISNHSDETLTSEAPYQNQQQNGRLLPKPSHSRQVSKQSQRPAESETLMMAYAQTMGYFILDGSLVNAAPFEEVKRKGVQGGGGVVGIERAKRSSGMFGAFSWGNLGESLGGLLGADDMSSMAQMKASAGSKSIPLLSTPQNLLFVDLRLAPGESRSYNYRFQLPRGLPPSYRGRAIKVSYHLALGVQRPEGQAIKTVDIPFRILGSYNSRGETLGHDLMSPYILLQDAARSKSIAPSPSSPFELPKFEPKTTSNQPRQPKNGLEDFLRYTERLLSESSSDSGTLASPTSPSTPHTLRKESIAEQGTNSIKDAIDLAILRANYTTSSAKTSEAQSANRFNIARGGQPVAVLTLLRPAYRLGEAVTGTIDFTAPASGVQSPTYAVLAELESVEKVDATLALRSSSSLNRITRKVHAAARENTLFSRQVSFSLTIPGTATPTFETTGVNLVWSLRVEFTTERQVQGLGLDSLGVGAGDGQGEGSELLEELGSDERGTTLIAKERLSAATFEIEVPLKVFGTPGIEPHPQAAGGGSVDGGGLEI